MKRFNTNAALFMAVGLMSGGTLQAQEKQVGDIADEFQLTDLLTNETVRLSDLEGSIVVLDFFFYW